MTAQDGELRLGVATADITPPLGSSLSGWDVDRRARWIHAPLLCRVIHLADGERAASVVTVDLLALSAAFADGVRADIESVAGVPRAAVLLAASHTHSGPVVPPWWLPSLDRPDERYLGELRRAIAETCAAAARAPEPVSVAYGEARCDLGVNRRRRADDGCVGWPPRADPSGAVDDTVGVLRFDREDGATRAVLFGYGCHPTVGGSSEWVGPDYPGAARRVIESFRPGAVAAFVLGNAGDVRSNYTHPDGSFRWDVTPALIEDAGARVAASVLEALAAARPIEMPRLTLGRAEREVRCSDGSPAPRCEFIAVRLGDVAIVSNPGETFCEIGLEVRRAVRMPLLFASLTNGAIGYVPTEAARAEGGYEIETSHHGYGLPAPIGPGAHAAFREGMLSALAEASRDW